MHALTPRKESKMARRFLEISQTSSQKRKQWSFFSHMQTIYKPFSFSQLFPLSQLPSQTKISLSP